MKLGVFFFFWCCLLSVTTCSVSAGIVDNIVKIFQDKINDFMTYTSGTESMYNLLSFPDELESFLKNSISLNPFQARDRLIDTSMNFLATRIEEMNLENPALGEKFTSIIRSGILMEYPTYRDIKTEEVKSVKPDASSLYTDLGDHDQQSYHPAFQSLDDVHSPFDSLNFSGFNQQTSAATKEETVVHIVTLFVKTIGQFISDNYSNQSVYGLLEVSERLDKVLKDSLARDPLKSNRGLVDVALDFLKAQIINCGLGNTLLESRLLAIINDAIFSHVPSLFSDDVLPHFPLGHQYQPTITSVFDDALFSHDGSDDYGLTGQMIDDNILSIFDSKVEQPDLNPDTFIPATSASESSTAPNSGSNVLTQKPTSTKKRSIDEMEDDSKPEIDHEKLWKRAAAKLSKIPLKLFMFVKEKLTEEEKKTLGVYILSSQMYANLHEIFIELDVNFCNNTVLEHFEEELACFIENGPTGIKSSTYDLFHDTLIETAYEIIDEISQEDGKSPLHLRKKLSPQIPLKESGPNPAKMDSSPRSSSSSSSSSSYVEIVPVAPATAEVIQEPHSQAVLNNPFQSLKSMSESSMRPDYILNHIRSLYAGLIRDSFPGLDEDSKDYLSKIVDYNLFNCLDRE
jgi:hypothetical protein